MWTLFFDKERYCKPRVYRIFQYLYARLMDREDPMFLTQHGVGRFVQTKL